MRTWWAAAALAWGVTTTSVAAEEEFLLGDLGFRLVLDKTWKATSWSDWAFEGARADGTALVYVWADEVQVTPTSEGLDTWRGGFLEKVESLNGSGAQVRSAEVRTVAGAPMARFEIAYTFGRAPYVMEGAVFAAEGQTVSVALVTFDKAPGAARETLDAMLASAEYRKPPAPVVEGAPLTAKGVTAKVPAGGWRVPTSVEADVVASTARNFAIEELEGCGSAIRGRAGGEADVLVVCPASVRLGVLDGYSFEGVDADVRAKLFKGVPIRGVERVENHDGRSGLLYTVEAQTGGLVAGLMPYGEGVARVFAYAPAGAGEDLPAAVRDLLVQATFEGDAPIAVAERASYYVRYRPFSPPVLGGAAVLMAALAGVVAVLRRGAASTGPRSHDD